MLRPKEINYLLNLATQAAKRAAAAIQKNPIEMQKIESSSKHDVKIVADRKLESLIIKQLRRKTDFAILTEERGLILPLGRDYGYRWIIDPLDGSLNFSRGIPLACISIALWRKTTPILAVVYDFNNNETFIGIMGKGAWLNGTRITPSRIYRKEEAILGTGLPSKADLKRDFLIRFFKTATDFKKARWMGSAALSLAYVACGRLDAYEENNIHLWDVAAGIVLVEAAGGRLKLIPSAKKDTFTIRAANRYLFKKGEIF